MPLDPSLYGSFLEMLKKILEQFKENWDEIYKQLEELREKLSEEQIRECFNYDYYTKNVDKIYARVFGEQSPNTKKKKP